MSNAIRCDFCGAFSETDGPHLEAGGFVPRRKLPQGWLEVHAIVGPAREGGDMAVFEVCSIDCAQIVLQPHVLVGANMHSLNRGLPYDPEVPAPA